MIKFHKDSQAIDILPSGALSTLVECATWDRIGLQSYLSDRRVKIIKREQWSTMFAIEIQWTYTISNQSLPELAANHRMRSSA
jgi:hypothetical protein